jgi:hypothetical protein
MVWARQLPALHVQSLEHRMLSTMLWLRVLSSLRVRAACRLAAKPALRVALLAHCLGSCKAPVGRCCCLLLLACASWHWHQALLRC